MWGMESILSWPQGKDCVWPWEYHLISLGFSFPNYEIQRLYKHHLLDDCLLQQYVLFQCEAGRGEIGKVVETGG